jgi:hypothetical protein
MKKKDDRKNESTYRRWCYNTHALVGKKREKTYFPKGKKMSVDKAFDIIVKGLLDGKGLHPSVDYIWFAEKIAAECNVHVDIVRQVLHRLNLAGCCSRRRIWNSRSWSSTMHTRLDMHGDDPVQWEAKQYNIDLEKLREKFG